MYVHFIIKRSRSLELSDAKASIGPIKLLQIRIEELSYRSSMMHKIALHISRQSLIIHRIQSLDLPFDHSRSIKIG